MQPKHVRAPKKQCPWGMKSAAKRRLKNRTIDSLCVLSAERIGWSIPASNLDLCDFPLKSTQGSGIQRKVSRKPGPFNILSVEDNLGDRLLIHRFFQAKPGSFELDFVDDGAEAMDYLFQRNRFHSAPRPDLVLLDLNLQKMDGKEVLRAIKTSDALAEIPVFILTTSTSSKDRDECLKLKAERFYTKPSDLTSFTALLQSIGAWLQGRTPNSAKPKPSAFRGIRWSPSLRLLQA